VRKRITIITTAERHDRRQRRQRCPSGRLAVGIEEPDRIDQAAGEDGHQDIRDGRAHHCGCNAGNQPWLAPPVAPRESQHVMESPRADMDTIGRHWFNTAPLTRRPIPANKE